MSWIRDAFKKIEAQEHEKLYQTVFGGYGTKTSIFWALDPVDVPVTLKEHVEETVQEDAVGESKCAIIRLESLPSYNDEELQAIGQPPAWLSVYIGTDASNVVYDRRFNICQDRKSVTPKDGSSSSLVWAEIEGNAVSKRLRRLSVTMGWTEPPPLVRRKFDSIVDDVSPTSPIVAPVADRRLSLACVDQQPKTEPIRKRLTRKLSLRPGWMELQSPTVDDHSNGHDENLQAALAAFKGFRPTNSESPPENQEFTVSGPSAITLRNMRKMSMAKRASYYSPGPDTISFHEATVGTSHQRKSLHLDEASSPPIDSQLGIQLSDRQEVPTTAIENHLPEKMDVKLPARRMNKSSSKWIFLLVPKDIPENEEMPTTNSQSLPGQPDPLASNEEALAALEGTRNPSQASQVLETPEVTFTPRRLKRMSAKRVSLFLEGDIPEAGESETGIDDSCATAPVTPNRRKASVEYALAALEAPTPTRANMGRPRRPHPAGRSRKTVSMYLETRPTLVAPKATDHDLERRSFSDTDLPETEFESTSRRLKRLSWNVIGRALPRPQQTDGIVSSIDRPETSTDTHSKGSAAAAKRQSWLPKVKPNPEVPVGLSFEVASKYSLIPSTPPSVPERRVEPVPRKKNRSSWYSMDPMVAEIQCSPRKEYGPPPPWLEPIVQPTHSIKPENGTSRKLKRTSWYPAAKEGQPDPTSPLRSVSLATGEVSDELAGDTKLRKKLNRMSKFLVSAQEKKKYAQKVSPQLGGPLNSHPSSLHPSRSESPVDKPHMSRMKKVGLRLGRLFH